ncbi:MAG TPA: SH3 domain-containing protein [Pyrinomonadaceae bacterium]|nr:SH3 domain-containing protein [Pyrinomonadaceae bacterium]
MKKIISIIPVIIVLGLSIVSAQKAVEKCMIRGWVQDKELRKSIHIYKVPSWIYAGTHNDPFNGYLDNSLEPGEEKPVEIIGFKSVPSDGQWIELRKATDINGKVLFDGDGWIEAERVTAKVWSSDGKAAVLYSLPKLSGKKIGTIPNNTFLTITGFDCFGLKVKYKGKTGWLSRNNICGNPFTFCS